MDPLHSALTWLDHNRYTAVGLGLVAAMAVWLVGCQSTTASLLGDGKEVTRAGVSQQATMIAASIAQEEAEINQRIAVYNARVAAHNQMVEAAYADLDEKDAFKNQIINSVGGAVVKAVTGGGFDAATLIGTALTVVGGGGLAAGVGTKLDNRRKDKKIAEFAAATKKG